MTNPYGRISHHLFKAREELHRHKTESDEERRMHVAAMLHLDSVILLVRRLHHHIVLWAKRG